jgi:hypothetical protein
LVKPSSDQLARTFREKKAAIRLGRGTISHLDRCRSHRGPT